MLDEYLNEALYDASAAGLGWDLSVSGTGSITVGVGGYAEKIPVLLSKMLDALSIDSSKVDA